VISLRWRIGDVYIVIDGDAKRGWRVEVTDAMHNPIEGPERERALEQINDELSSVRRHIWRNELKR
jgi:hypothetical protein